MCDAAWCAAAAADAATTTTTTTTDTTTTTSTTTTDTTTAESVHQTHSVLVVLPSTTDGVGWVQLFPAFSTLFTTPPLHAVSNYNTQTFITTTTTRRTTFEPTGDHVSE